MRFPTSQTNFSPYIPLSAELGGLANLGTLYLDTNRLSGEDTPELGNLGNLDGLSLGRNKLKGCVPTNLERQLDDRYRDLGMPFCAR